MVNIFTYNCYRALIKDKILDLRNNGLKVTQEKIAEQIRVKKSYLSQVMNFKAELNQDQAFLLGQYFKLTSDENEYFNLLIERERTGIQNRKNEIDKKIKTIQFKENQTKNYLNKNLNVPFEEYYLDPMLQVIHIAFTIKAFQKNPTSLSSKLRISPEYFNEIISKLARFGLIKKTAVGYQTVQDNFHIDPDSPYFSTWKSLFNIKSNEWIKNLTNDEKYNFIVTFSSDDETRDQIKIKFLEFIKGIEKLTKNSPSEKLYQLNFDLFKWLN